MEQFAPSIGEYLNIWWGVPSVLWILAATEGVKRISSRICPWSWLVMLAFGILGACLWTWFGPPPERACPEPTACSMPAQRVLAHEIALGVRAAFLAAGLFLTATESLARMRRDFDRSRSGGPDGDHP